MEWRCRAIGPDGLVGCLFVFGDVTARLLLSRRKQCGWASCARSTSRNVLEGGGEEVYGTATGAENEGSSRKVVLGGR